MAVSRVDPSVLLADRHSELAWQARRLADLQVMEREAAALIRGAGLDPGRFPAAALDGDPTMLDAVWRGGLGAVREALDEWRGAVEGQHRDEAAAHDAARIAQELEARRRPVVELAPGVTMDFVLVSEGPFIMGSSKTTRESPQREVYLDEYHLARYPVTMAQFAVFVRDSGFKPDAKTLKEVRIKGNHPVTHVSWDDARAFCGWLSHKTGLTVRLPTEAEWEKGARGSDGRKYPWGNEAPDGTRCNFMNGFFLLPGLRLFCSPTPVGQFSPRGDSPFGLADMAGNVWEWCSDP